MHSGASLSEMYHPSTHFVWPIIEILIRQVPASEMSQGGKAAHVMDIYPKRLVVRSLKKINK